jgi:hypothetical protein
VVPGQIGCCPDELASFNCSKSRNVVTHETVAALDEAQNAFALADAAIASDQCANPHYIDHTSVLCFGRGEIHLESNGGGIDEAHRNHWGAENGDLIFSGGFSERTGDGESAGDDDAGDMLLTKLGAALSLFLEAQTFQVTILCVSKDLNTFLREIDKKSGKGKPRSIDGWFPDLSVESVCWTNQLQVQRFSMPGVKFAHPGKR